MNITLADKALLRLIQLISTMRIREMKHIITFLIVSLAITIIGCKQDKPANNNVTITGSGTLVSQNMELTGFDTVEAGLHFDLVIQQGEQFSVIITSDDNFIEFIDVVQEATTISFGLRPEYAYNFYNTTLRAEVTMPEVAGLYLNGSSHAELDSLVDVADFVAELTGSSSLSGELEAESAALNVYGSTYVKLTGSGKRLQLDACGNSITDLSDFYVEDAALHTSCASTAEVNAAGRIDVDATQNSRVTYSGNPALGEVAAHEYAAVELESR